MGSYYLVLIPFILIFVWLIYILLIFPIFVMYKCSKNYNLSRSWRNAWLVVVAILWTPGACLYQLLHDHSLRAKISAISIAFTFTSLVGAFVWSVKNLNQETISQWAVDYMLKNQLTHELPPDQQEVLKDQLNNIQNDLKKLSAKDLLGGDLNEKIKGIVEQNMMAAEDLDAQETPSQAMLQLKKALDDKAPQDAAESPSIEEVAPHQEPFAGISAMQLSMRCQEAQGRTQAFYYCQDVARQLWVKDPGAAYDLLWKACQKGLESSCLILAWRYLRANDRKSANRALYWPCNRNSKPRSFCQDLEKQVQANLNSDPWERSIWKRSPKVR
ncbi:MAG: hypothetical protein KDD33_06190 [Bdellovibrionales bacterium]|nr:hypothetical protein [Bdellovibrionales bacterium]